MRPPLFRALFVVMVCLTFTRIYGQDHQSVNMMLYMMADNHAACTSVDAVTQLASIAGAFSTNSRISLLWQRSSEAVYCGDQTVLGQAPWTGARIFQVTSNALTVTADLGLVDTASPAVLSNFLTTAASGSTADINFLVLFGPGSYFTLGSQNHPLQSTTDTFWTYQALSTALTNAVRALNLPRGKLDLLLLDSSFSSSQENIQMFSSATTYFSGFQSVQPRPDYTGFAGLATIPRGPTLTREAISAAMGENYYKRLVAMNPSLPVTTFSLVDSTKIANVTEAFDTFSRAFRSLPQRTFAEVRRNVLEVDLAPLPILEYSAVDLGHLSYWMTYYRRFPFLQKGWGPALTRALDDAVIFSGSGDALAGATGISVYFPLTNFSISNFFTNTYYRQYEFNFAWYSFLVAYLFTPHEEFFFTTPRIRVNSDGSYDLSTNTTLDSVVQAYVFYGAQLLNDDDLGPLIVPSGAHRAEISGFSEANYITGRWDGSVWRIPNSDVPVFVQQKKSIRLVSFILSDPVIPSRRNILRGYFPADSTTVTTFYIQDLVLNVSPFRPKAGTSLFAGGTHPYLTSRNDFFDRFHEPFYSEANFTLPTDNLLQLELVHFTDLSQPNTDQNAYVFLVTRNIDDSFGSAGWRIPASDPSSTYLLTDQNRLLTNVTIGSVQVVAAGKTKLKIAVRNTGFRDSSINYLLVSGFPAGLAGFDVQPPNACRPTNASLTALKCLIDFIPAKSFSKLSILLPRRIDTPLSISASGNNFTPKTVSARIVSHTRNTANTTRRPNRTRRPNSV